MSYASSLRPSLKKYSAGAIERRGMLPARQLIEKMGGMNLTGNWGKVLERDAEAASREAVAAAMAAGLTPSSSRARPFQYENRFNDPKVIWRRQFQVPRFRARMLDFYL